MSKISCIIPDDGIKKLTSEIKSDLAKVSEAEEVQDPVAEEIESNRPVTLEDVMGYIREFCSQKGIEQKDWRMFEDEAQEYVRQRAKGLNPEVSEASGLEIAKIKLKTIIDTFKSFVRESKNFQKDHTYFVRLEDGKEVRATTTVSTYGRNLYKGKNPLSKEDIPMNVGMALGNTFDAVARDFFADNLKDSYPNLDSDRLNALVKGLEGFKSQLDQMFPDGYYVESMPFPIAAKLKDSRGKDIIIAGEMDLLVTDSRGNLYIYDMKAVKSTTSARVLIREYQNAMTLYGEILKAQFPELKSKIKGYGLLVAQTEYLPGKVNDNDIYTMTSNGQLYINDIPIQELNQRDYNITLTTSMVGKRGYTIGIITNEELEGQLESLTQEEREILEDAFGIEKDIKEAFNDMLQVQNSTVYSDPVSRIDTTQYMAPVTQDEIRQIGVTVGKYISYIIRKLQNNDTWRQDIFPEAEEDSFIGMPIDELLTNENLSRIINYIKGDILGANLADMSMDDPAFAKYDWIISNFDIVMQAASIEFLKNTGKSIRLENEATPSEDSDLVEDEEVEESETTERAAYSYSAREVSVQKSMSQTLKNLFSTLPEVSYRRIENEDGSVSWEAEDIVYDDSFGLIKFLDRDQTINALLEVLHNARTIEEMQRRMTDERYVEKYPWLPQINSLLEVNPSLKPSFYDTFRRNKTIYVRTTATVRYEYDPETRTSKRKVEIGNYDLVREGMRERLKSEFASRIMGNETQLFHLVKNSSSGLSTIDEDRADDLITMLEDAEQKSGRRKKSAMIIALSEALYDAGFGEHEDALRSIAGTEKFKTLYSNTKKFLTEARKKTKAFVPFNEVTHRKGWSLSNSINNNLADIVPARYEVSVYDNGKNYQVYTLPSFLGDLVDSLTSYNEEDGGQSIKEFIEEKYGKSFQTSYIGSDGKTHYISSWLEALAEEPYSANVMRHMVEVSSMDKQYQKMEPRDYTLSLIAEFFAPMQDSSIHASVARYAVPTMSDKPSSEFIQFYKQSFKDEKLKERSKDVLAEEAATFVLMEINRMRKVLWNAVYGGTKIDVYTPNIPKEVIAKLKARRKDKRKVKLTFSDILDADGNLQKWMQKGGVGFRFFDFFNAEFEKKTDFAKDVLDYLSNQPSDYYGVDLISDIKEIFKEGMEKKAIAFREMLASTMQLTEEDPYLKGILPSTQKFEDALDEYYWNATVANANILSMTIIDPAFYPDAVQVQKRYAQVHSMTERCDVSATFIDDKGTERRLSDGTHRYIIIEDNKLKSDLGKFSEALYDKFIASTVDPKRKEWLRKQKALAKKAFSEVNETDGQAFTSPEGHMKKLGMLGLLTPGKQSALQNIAKGMNAEEDFGEAIQAFKPFVFTWETIRDNDGEWIVPVQLKDSEDLLSMSGDILNSFIEQGIIDRNSPLIALFNVLHESAYTDGVWNGHGIDTVVFHSAVKTGGYRVIPELSSLENPEEVLRSYIENGYVHEHPFYDWGRQQNVPPHFQDHTQAMPTQTRVLGVSDVEASETTSDGRTVGETRKEYFQNIHDDMEIGYEDSNEIFKTSGTRTEQVEAKSDLLKEALQKDARTTFEELKAISVNNGEFNIPLGDPVRSERYSSTIFSAIKSRVNKEKIPGGPIVQTTCWGLRPPKIAFNEDGTIKHIGVYLTCPSEKLEAMITRKDGSLMSVDEVVKKGIIPESALYGVTSRVPVENKYSIFPMKIEAFLPRVIGEKIMFPSEVTVLNGGDFDIDKAFPELKFTSWGNKKTTDRQNLKDRIVEGQYQILSSQGGSTFILSPQDVSELKEIALELDPLYKDNKMSMTDPMALIYFQHQNMTGKAMVAISASTNVAHALLSMCGVGIRIPSLTFNGFSLSALEDSDGYITLDPVWSPIDGSLISRSTGALVGASADCAKDPLIASIGYNPVTANWFTGLLRIGVPMRTVSLLMSQNVVKDMALRASMNSSFSAEIQKYLHDAVKNLRMKYTDILNIAEKEDFTDDMLMENLRNPDENTDLKIVAVLQLFSSTADNIFKISQIVNLNSAQNAVGPTSFDTLKKIFSIREFFDIIKEGMPDSMDLKKTIYPFRKDTGERLYTNLPFLDPLIRTYTELVPKVMQGDFLPFSNAVMGLLDYMRRLKISIGNMSVKQLRNLINDFYVYMATGKIGGVKMLDASFNERKRILYDVPIEVAKSKNSIYNIFTNLLQFKEKSGKQNLPSLELNTSAFPSDMRDTLSSAWAALVNQDNPFLETTVRLSDDLMQYNIFKYGFNFSPQGFLNLAPNIVKTSFKNGKYIVFSDARNWNSELEKEDYYNFLLQRVRNTYKNNSSVETLTKEAFEANTVQIGRSSENRFYIDDKVYISPGTLAIRVGRSLYLRESPDNRMFRLSSSLGFDTQGKEYNREEDALRMQSVKSLDYYKKIINDFRSYEIEEALEDTEEEETYSESEEFTPERTESEWNTITDLLNDNDFVDWAAQMSAEEGDSILKENADAVEIIKKNLKEKLGGEEFTSLRAKVEEFIERKNICK